MQTLHHCPDVSRISPVQSGLPVLRCAPDPAHDQDAHTRIRVQSAQAQHAGSVGGAWSQRIRNPRLGKRADGYWPGACFGAREPDPAEMPISWAEVMHGVDMEVIG